MGVCFANVLHNKNSVLHCSISPFLFVRLLCAAGEEQESFGADLLAVATHRFVRARGECDTAAMAAVEKIEAILEVEAGVHFDGSAIKEAAADEAAEAAAAAAGEEDEAAAAAAAGAEDTRKAFTKHVCIVKPSTRFGHDTVMGITNSQVYTHAQEAATATVTSTAAAAARCC